MSDGTIKQDLEKHPELAPILDADRDGNIICIGWVSPIFTWEDVPRIAEEWEDKK